MVSFTGVIYFILILIPVFYVVRFLSKTSILHMIIKSWQSLIDKLHVYQFYKVPQFNQNKSLQENQLFRKINLYLNSLPNLDDSSDFTTLLSGPKSHDIFFQHDTDNRPIHETFLSSKLTWTHQNDDDVSSYVLKIKKADKKRVFRQYFQHILTITDELEQRSNNKDIKLYMNLISSCSSDVSIQRWRSVPFAHPATMDTVVMDPELKNKVKSDLEQFLKSKQYYTRLGRVWKRSYLLYGPSGTGKTSFAAAMAKFLSYDVYEIDMSKLDSENLKLLLLQIPPKSLILVENIDCHSPELFKTIVSSCGDERVTVFTAKAEEQVGPIVDVRIHFVLCDFAAFKTLANSYLGLKEHKLFPAVEEVFSTGGSLSAAEIGEIMISNRGSSPSRALKAVITALQNDVEEKTTVKVAQALTSSGSGRSTSEEEGGGGVFCRESVHTVREFRKLYGLLRLGSRRKEEPPVVVPLDRSSSEKEGSRHERMLV